MGNRRLKKEELFPLFYLFSIIRWDPRGLSIFIDHSTFIEILLSFTVIIQRHIVQINNSNRAIDTNISVFFISEQKSQ